MLQLYTCLVLFPASCTASQKSEYIAAVNSSVMLNAIAEGPGNEHYKYHWGKINNDLLPNTVSGQDTANLVITPASTFDKGLYYCNVTTQWGTTCTSNSGSLQVLSKCVHYV